MPTDLTRRSVLLGIGTLAAACSSASGPDHASDPSSPSHPATSTAARPGLPTVTAWRPSPNDTTPAAKLSAVRRVERAGNGRDSALQVIDAQYGGILGTTASVLVVTRSWQRVGPTIHPGGRTYDVRLSLRGSRWQVTDEFPSRPGAPAAELTSLARRVLANDRIGLPPAARRDLRSGQVHESVLRAMLTVATTFRIEVSVIRSGHPIHVFGTDRLSDHPRGRAFDTWRIDGHPVVDARTPRRLVTDYMHAVAAAGSYNVGGPYLLGSAPQWFSDNTHHDHVHAGFLT